MTISIFQLLSKENNFEIKKSVGGFWGIIDFLTPSIIVHVMNDADPDLLV